MRLLYSPASPYSAKVRMTAAHLGIPLDAVVTDTNAMPAELLDANPLGKIPVLVTDEGVPIFDSRVIMRHLDRLSDGRLYPADGLEAAKGEALADGLCDCLLAHVYERRMRPAEKVHEPWLDRQWDKATRALDVLERDPPADNAAPDAGSIALRAALGYLALRFGGLWEGDRPNLIAWTGRFDRRHPGLAALVPA